MNLWLRLKQACSSVCLISLKPSICDCPRVSQADYNVTIYSVAVFLELIIVNEIKNQITFYCLIDPKFDHFILVFPYTFNVCMIDAYKRYNQVHFFQHRSNHLKFNELTSHLVKCLHCLSNSNASRVR